MCACCYSLETTKLLVLLSSGVEELVIFLFVACDDELEAFVRL